MNKILHISLLSGDRYRAIFMQKMILTVRDHKRYEAAAPYSLLNQVLQQHHRACISQAHQAYIVWQA